jgi:hypothetical protein
MANIARMTKKQLVAHGKKIGMNLSMDSTRKTMIAEIKGAKKPVQTAKAKTVAQPQNKSILQSVREFFGL